MAAGDSALVPIDTEDTVDAIFAKVRGTGVASVQLLVPDNTAALQTPRGFERLARRLESAGVQLLVISSDAQTLDAARRNQILTMAVQGARVQTPPGAAPTRYTTQVLPKMPANKGDADFLDALDQVPARDRYADLPDVDADLYAALDELPPPQTRGSSTRPLSSSDDDFAASLDEWSDMSAGAAASDRDLERSAPPRRYSADDVALSDDDLTRQRGARRTTAQRARADARATPARAATGARRRGAAYDDDLDDYQKARPSLARLLLPLAVLALIVLVAVYWFASSRTSVSVAPPAAAASAHPFKGEIIPLATGSATAIEAAPVTADAEVRATGVISVETLSPATTAKAELTLVNTIESPVPLPKGSEFIGTNAKGEQVRFTLDADVTVPPAVTTTSLAGRSTTYGQINVNVTARSPGSASNVAENAIKQILIPGQQPIVSDSSNFLIRHPAITSGTDQPQRIVTEADVQALLGPLLTQLNYAGMEQLRAKIDESKFGIDGTSVVPSPTDLADPANYDPLVVEPAIGQPVADPANPTFTVTARAHFKALAIPSGQSVAKQLETVAPKYFAERTDRPCKAGETQATLVDAIHWDGERLTIDGAINCQAPGGLPADTLAKVRDAVRGQSREAAENNLRSLQNQGLIGGYQLPDRASFPRFDFLLNVAVGQPQVVDPQPTTGAP